MEDEDTGLRIDWHGVQEGKYQNFNLDTKFTREDIGRMRFNGLMGLEASEREQSLNSLIPFHFYG